MNAIGLAIEVLKLAYVGLLLAIMIALFAPMVRSFTKNTQPKDFDYMLFWMLAFNRLWFFIRAAVFPNPIDQQFEAETTIVVYIFAIAVEAGVLLSYFWHRKKA